MISPAQSFITNIPTYSTLYSTLVSTVRTPPNLKMHFKAYVEIGKVALVNYGKDYEKIIVIVDVIEQN